MNIENKVDENSENIDKNGQSTEDSENLGEDDGIEPGELPSINESKLHKFVLCWVLF